MLAADEDELLRLAEHLPSEAAEAVLNLATGVVPRCRQPRPRRKIPSPPRRPAPLPRHDGCGGTQTGARIPVGALDRLPASRPAATVERTYNGPARVSGSAGTGKTVVALHRAAHLARAHADARVLLTTFSIPLARNLRSKVDRLIGADIKIRERIAVRSIDELGREVYEANFGTPTTPTRAMLRSLIKDAISREAGITLSLSFIESEWNDVVDAWQIESWEAVPRCATPRPQDPPGRETAQRALVGLRSRAIRTARPGPCHPAHDLPGSHEPHRRWRRTAR